MKKSKILKIGLIALLLLGLIYVLILLSNDSQNKKLSRLMQDIQTRHFSFNNYQYQIATKSILDKVKSGDIKGDINDPKSIALNQLSQNKDKLAQYFKGFFNPRLIDKDNESMAKTLNVGDIMRRSSIMQTIYQRLGLRSVWFAPDSLSFNGNTNRDILTNKSTPNIMSKLQNAYVADKFQTTADVAMSINEANTLLGGANKYLSGSEEALSNTIQELNSNTDTSAENISLYADFICSKKQAAQLLYQEAINRSQVYQMSTTLQSFVIGESAEQSLLNKEEMSSFVNYIFPISIRNYLELNPKQNNSFDRWDIINSKYRNVFEELNKSYMNQTNLNSYCDGELGGLSKVDYINNNGNILDQIKTVANNSKSNIVALESAETSFNQQIPILQSIASTNWSGLNLSSPSQYKKLSYNLEAGASALASLEMRASGGHPLTNGQYKEIVNYYKREFASANNFLARFNPQVLAHHAGATTKSFVGIKSFYDYPQDDDQIMIDQYGVVVYGFTLDELLNLSSEKPANDFRTAQDQCLGTTDSVGILACQQGQKKNLSDSSSTNFQAQINYGKYILECHLANNLAQSFVNPEASGLNYTRELYTKLSFADQNMFDPCVINSNQSETVNKITPVNYEQLDTLSSLLIQRLSQNDKLISAGDDQDKLIAKVPGLCDKYSADFTEIYNLCLGKLDDSTYAGIKECFSPKLFGAKFEYNLEAEKYKKSESFSLSEFNPNTVEVCLSNVSLRSGGNTGDALDDQSLASEICNNFKKNYPNLYRECQASISSENLQTRTLHSICYRAASAEQTKLSNFLNNCFAEAEKLNQVLNCAEFSYQNFDQTNLSIEDKRIAIMQTMSCDNLKYAPRYNFSLLSLDTGYYDKEVEYLFNQLKSYKNNLTIQFARNSDKDQVKLWLTYSFDSNFNDNYQNLIDSGQLSGQSIQKLYAYNPLKTSQNGREANWMIDGAKKCINFFSQNEINPSSDTDKELNCNLKLAEFSRQPNTIYIELRK